jgi:RAS guanyl-releasing protein 3
MELLSSNYNYGHYRKTIAELHGFYIPIIGIHLKDMISLHTAHLDRLENDLINFRKMGQLAAIFQPLTNLQNAAPPLQEHRDLIKLLQLSLDMSYSEDEMYELSLSREPRTSVSAPATPTRASPFAAWAQSLSTPLDPHTIQKHVLAMVEAVYKNYDHDRDGFISHDEFAEIAQNFPFIDAFSVLDADKDGMISKIEMKAYFLKANFYSALKSEFKHDFHETTYFKLTFCTHCDGLLWGLIKQGWKCKDCGMCWGDHFSRHKLILGLVVSAQLYIGLSHITITKIRI